MNEDCEHSWVESEYFTVVTPFAAWTPKQRFCSSCRMFENSEAEELNVAKPRARLRWPMVREEDLFGDRERSEIDRLRYERDRLEQELRKATAALEDCIERERRAK
jgi:hypothetical protein